MSFNANVFKVLISSPSDVERERSLVSEVIAEFNVLHAQKNQTVLLPVHWETHSYPNFGQRPQEELNKQIVDDCDLLVGMFWTRVGTPTGKAISGTVEEIERHTEKKKPAMLYFSQVPAAPQTLDTKQLEEVKKLKEKYRGTALYHEYDSPEKFKDKFRMHLTQMVFSDAHFKLTITDRPEATRGEEVETPMSKKPPLDEREAKALLLAANGDGVIMHLAFLGGETVQTAGQVLMAQDAKPKEVAAWKAALKGLERKGLIEQTGGERGSEIYEVTHEGHLLAEQMRNGQQITVFTW